MIEQRRLRTITSCIHSTSSPSPSYRRRRTIAPSHGGQSSPSYDSMSPTITSCSHGVRHLLEVAEVACRSRQEWSNHHSCSSGRTIIAAATARRRRRLSRTSIVVHCEGLGRAHAGAFARSKTLPTFTSCIHSTSSPSPSLIAHPATVGSRRRRMIACRPPSLSAAVVDCPATGGRRRRRDSMSCAKALVEPRRRLRWITNVNIMSPPRRRRRRLP